MSTIQFNAVTGLIDSCAQGIVQVGAFLAEGRAASQDYLQQQLGTQAANEILLRQQDLCFELDPCLIRQVSITHIQAQVQEIRAATTIPQLERASNQLERTVHSDQQKIVHELTPLIVQATRTTGFTTVKELRSPERVLIIGQNPRGQALQHEILAVPKQPLTIRTETLGFQDKSCTEALNQFEKNLQKQGVTIKQQDQIGTLRRLAKQQIRIRR